MGLFDRLKRKKPEDTSIMFDYSIGDFEKITGQEKLSLVQQWYSRAYGNYATEMQLINDRDQLYFGANWVDKDVNNKSAKRQNKLVKDANLVRNLVYELIESERDTNVPDAIVTAQKENREYQEEMIMNCIKSQKDKLDMVTLNDKTEQTTYIQGETFTHLIWREFEDSNKQIKGEFILEEIHPKQFIPQPGVWDIDKMDYFFIVQTVTKPYVRKRFGVEVTSLNEMYPNQNTTQASIQYNSYELVSMITCYYRNEDGTIGRFVYANMRTLEDTPNIYQRKFKKCEQCGEVYPWQTEQCPDCKVKLKEETKEFENLMQEVQIHSGVDDEGNDIYETIPQGAKIRYFDPKVYPVVMRVNVPKSFKFGGQSDVDTLRGYQDAVKKLGSIAEEKMVNSTTIVTMPSSLQKQLTTDPYNIIYLESADQKNQIDVIDVQGQITKELEFIDAIENWGKNTLGVTDSFQGQYDPSAKSGKAKAIQIQQSAGRLASKLANKYQYYKELYRKMFYFFVCFADDKIPVIKYDENSHKQIDYFDRYQLLCPLPVSKEGEEQIYYYDVDYLFRAENTADFSKDKETLKEETLMLQKMNIIDATQTMQILDHLGFPLAKMMLKQADKMANEIQKGQNAMGGQGNEEMIMEAMKRLPPEQQQQFMEMPPEEQQQFIQQIISTI